MAIEQEEDAQQGRKLEPSGRERSHQDCVRDSRTREIDGFVPEFHRFMRRKLHTRPCRTPRKVGAGKTTMMIANGRNMLAIMLLVIGLRRDGQGAFSGSLSAG